MTSSLKSRKPPSTVDDALDQFWLDRSIPGNVPNYMGFLTWIRERDEVARSSPPLPIHAQNLSAPPFQLAAQLFKAAELAGIEITPEGVRPKLTFGRRNGKNSKLKFINRGKLLLSYFRDLPPRQLQMFMMMTKDAGFETSVKPGASQLQHRAAFFRAVALGDEHLAFKMVGRLREEEHDPGELAFLEATASFHSNRFDEAIRHAREVPRDAIDWSRAFMLELESYALKGDIKALLAAIRATPEFVAPEFFIPYLCQIAVGQSPHPEAALEQAVEMIEEKTRPSEPGIGAFKMWNRQSCQLAVQLVEQQHELALRESALEQGQCTDHATKETDHIPLRLRQIACALKIDADLASRLSIANLDQAYQEIVKRLINYSKAERLDYLDALLVQWRIGDRLVFLENVIKNLDVLVADSTPETWQLVVWAHQEAQIQKRPVEIQLLRTRLLGSPTMARQLKAIETVAEESMIERQLSPMGRLALRSANWDLARAEEDSHLWRDAGMISLGFFRILELEFNERLILPAMQTLDMDAFEKRLGGLEVDQSQKSKAVEFWKKMKPPLLRAKNQGKGLELGALELLLRKVAQIDDVDRDLKEMLHSGLSAYLSAGGVEALRSRRLADLVDESARERFRNPPAHSRYVDLATAKDCKRYVDASLNQLITYTTDRAIGNSTLH
jgi:hypothetical protein